MRVGEKTPPPPVLTHPPPAPHTPAPPATPLVQETGPSDWASPLLPAPPPLSSPAACLGKFDALHRGHARLAVTAAAPPARHTPWLVSFSGMAAELGWAPRRPLVAPDDRARVLGSWAAACGGTAPRQRVIPFAAVRTLSPAAFVDVLIGALGARHVVVGAGYRFGHKAAGDTDALTSLCAAQGVGVTVVPLVATASCGGDDDDGEEAAAAAADPPIISSSAVRAALAAGRLAEVEALLGRRYRLVAHVGAGGAGRGRSMR